MTDATRVLNFQQENKGYDTIHFATQQGAFEDVLSDSSSGMYSSVWTFTDTSQLYLEDDTFYARGDDKWAL